MRRLPPQNRSCEACARWSSTEQKKGGRLMVRIEKGGRLMVRKARDGAWFVMRTVSKSLYSLQRKPHERSGLLLLPLLAHNSQIAYLRCCGNVRQQQF